jgi:hypothetical protein
MLMGRGMTEERTTARGGYIQALRWVMHNADDFDGMSYHDFIIYNRFVYALQVALQYSPHLHIHFGSTFPKAYFLWQLVANTLLGHS